MKTAKFIKRILLIVFVLGIVFIALYPFDVPNLIMKIETNNGTKELRMLGYDLRRDLTDQIEFDDNYVEIRKVKIYRTFQSICLRTIDYTEFVSFIDLEQTGGFQVVNESLAFNNPDHVILFLNETGKNELKKQASTLWLERIMLAEIWAIVCAIGLIACQVISEKQKDNRYNHGPLAESKRFFRDIRKYWQYMVFAA